MPDLSRLVEEYRDVSLEIEWWELQSRRTNRRRAEIMLELQSIAKSKNGGTLQGIELTGEDDVRLVHALCDEPYNVLHANCVRVVGESGILRKLPLYRLGGFGDFDPGLRFEVNRHGIVSSRFDYVVAGLNSDYFEEAAEKLVGYVDGLLGLIKIGGGYTEIDIGTGSKHIKLFDLGKELEIARGR